MIARIINTVRRRTLALISLRFVQRYLSSAIIVFAGAVVILLWTGVALLVRHERENSIEEVKTDNANLARAFAEHTFRTLNYIDQLSRLLAMQYERFGIKFDLPRYFEENHVDDKLVINSVISDETGLTILSSQRNFQPANLSDREHVRVHMEHDNGRLFISKPVFARVAKRWSFIATRRVNKPDGSYGGVVGIAVDPFYFSTFYKQVDLGKDSLVSLTGSDGIIRARIFGEDQSVGQDVGKGAVFTQYHNAERGTLVATTRTDGVRRIYAFHRVQDYPLFIVLGVSEAVALAPAIKQQRYYFLIAALVSFALFATATGLALLLAAPTTFGRRSSWRKSRADTTAQRDAGGGQRDTGGLPRPGRLEGSHCPIAAVRAGTVGKRIWLCRRDRCRAQAARSGV